MTSLQKDLKDYFDTFDELFEACNLESMEEDSEIKAIKDKFYNSFGIPKRYFCKEDLDTVSEALKVE